MPSPMSANYKCVCVCCCHRCARVVLFFFFFFLLLSPIKSMYSVGGGGGGGRLPAHTIFDWSHFSPLIFLPQQNRKLSLFLHIDAKVTNHLSGCLNLGGGGGAGSKSAGLLALWLATVHRPHLLLLLCNRINERVSCYYDNIETAKTAAPSSLLWWRHEYSPPSPPSPVIALVCRGTSSSPSSPLSHRCFNVVAMMSSTKL